MRSQQSLDPGNMGTVHDMGTVHAGSVLGIWYSTCGECSGDMGTVHAGSVLGIWVQYMQGVFSQLFHGDIAGVEKQGD